MNDQLNSTEYAKKIRYESNKNNSCIPEEYFRYKTSMYDFNDGLGKTSPSKVNAYNRVIEYIDNIKQYAENGKGLYIYGSAGSNKKLGLTLLGTFVLRAALNNYFTVRFVEFQTLILDLSSFQDINAEIYYNVDYLMIDSINCYKSLNTPKIRTSLSDIIFFRRTNKKPIIFSSYNSVDVLSGSYCDTLSNYIQSNSVVIQIEAESGKKEFSLLEIQHMIGDELKNNPSLGYTKFTSEEIKNFIECSRS